VGHIFLDNFEVSNIFLGHTFSESLGCKLVENYDEFKNSSLLFQGIVKQSKKFGSQHVSKQTLFSYPIFRKFLQNTQKIRKGPYFMNSTSSGEFEVLYR
jgi:hypothetical protein